MGAWVETVSLKIHVDVIHKNVRQMRGRPGRKHFVTVPRWYARITWPDGSVGKVAIKTKVALMMGANILKTVSHQLALPGVVA